jgi:hypothetical protein
MRRLLVTLSLVGLSFASSPQAAVAEVEGRTVCEGYCGTAAVGCYVVASIFVGRDKCDAMYGGCLDGCMAALIEEEI